MSLDGHGSRRHLNLSAPERVPLERLKLDFGAGQAGQSWKPKPCADLFRLATGFRGGYD
jgi:hypothetical protein